MPHHWFQHGRPAPPPAPVPPPLPPRNPIQNHGPPAAQPPADGTEPYSPSMSSRPPGYDQRPGTSSSGGALSPNLPGSSFPKPPLSPNKRQYHYPPPPPGPPPGQPGYSRPPMPPLPPRPATSSPNLGPQSQGRVYSPPAVSPITPSSAGFPIPPPPSRSPQPYSYTPSGPTQYSRMALHGDVGISSSPSPPFVSPQETPLSSSVPNSPPPPYSNSAAFGTQAEPTSSQGPLRSSSVSPVPPRFASPPASNSMPVSPLPQPARVDSIRVRPSLSQRTTGSSGSRTPATPSAAADNLDALLQSLSVEFRIPSPATPTFPEEDVSPSRINAASPPPLEPRKAPQSRPAPVSVDRIASPSLGNLPSPGRPHGLSPPASPPYPIIDDGTPAQPAIPLFMERYHQTEFERPNGPKVYKAYRPEGNEADNVVRPATAKSKQFLSYNPDNTAAKVEPVPAIDKTSDPESKSSFGPLRPVTMLFDPYQQQRIGVAQEPPSVTRCIDTPVTFATDWYWHPDVPDFLACSRCYVDHIFKTKFRSFFENKRIEADGSARVCSFRHPRMRNLLFRRAVTSGSMNEALDWMQSRVAIPDCSGMAGIRGADAPGLRWYKPRMGDVMPGFICCEACYQDRLMCCPQLAEAEFIESTPQQPQDHWACDMASPYLQREYEICIAGEQQSRGWQNFCREAGARIAMPLCAGFQLMNTSRRTWFVPDDSDLSGLVLCQACYCDSILHSGQETQWRTAPEISDEASSTMVRCGMCIPNIRTAFNRAADQSDHESFWSFARQVISDRFCDPEGIAGAKWFVLKSSQEDPSSAKDDGFRVCGACRAGIFEVLQMADVLEPMPEQNASRGPVYITRQSQTDRHLCSLNPSHSRFANHLALIYEAFLTRSAAALVAYAAEYATIPPCPRGDTEIVRQASPARRWFGWYNCTICPECYYGFVVKGGHDALASSMELHDQILGSSDEGNSFSGGQTNTTTMCELYSQRMRNLFASCARSSPPDPAALLHFSSAQRRLVYMETVPPIRDILSQVATTLEEKRIATQIRITRNNIHRISAQSMSIPTLGCPPGGTPRQPGRVSPQQTTSGALSTLEAATSPPVLMVSPASLNRHGQAWIIACRELLAAAQQDRSVWATVLQSAAAAGQPPQVMLNELERRWRSVE